MNRTAPLFALALASTLSLSAGVALADDADKAACVDKDEGDECTDGDGDAGFCEWDDSDRVLSCDDDGASSSSSSGCSASGSSGGDASGVIAAFGALALVRRRRSAKA